MPGLEHDDAVARRHRVDQCRLPRAGAGGGIDHHHPLGLEDPFHAGDHLAPELAEFRAAVIDGRHRDRLQDPVGHVGRTGNLQEMAAGVRGGSILHRRNPGRENREQRYTLSPPPRRRNPGRGAANFARRPAPSPRKGTERDGRGECGRRIRL